MESVASVLANLDLVVAVVVVSTRNKKPTLVGGRFGMGFVVHIVVKVVLYCYCNDIVSPVHCGMYM